MSDSKCNLSPIESSQVKVGFCVLLKGRPCKVVSVTIAKTGKHGHMKVTITGIDVLNGQKNIICVPGHVVVMKFELDKNEYPLIRINDDELEYLDEHNNLMTLKVPDGSEIVKQLKNEFNDNRQYLVTIIKVPYEKSKDVNSGKSL